MAKPPDPLTRIELLQGTLDLIILQTLRWGPRHGYGLAQPIRASSGDVLQVETRQPHPPPPAARRACAARQEPARRRAPGTTRLPSPHGRRRPDGPRRIA